MGRGHWVHSSGGTLTMYTMVVINGRLYGVYPGSLADTLALYDPFQLYGQDFPMVEVSCA
jgi:hypothetical protein